MDDQTPQQLEKSAKAAYQKGDYAKAAAEFSAAAEKHHLLNDHLLWAEMRNNQSVALLQNKDAQAAYDAAAGLESVFIDAGDNLKLAMTYGNQAAALDALNQIEEAEAKYKNSASLLQKEGESDLYSQVMKSLSALQLRSGRQIEALASMQSGVEDVEKPSLTQRALKKLLKIPFKLIKK